MSVPYVSRMRLNPRDLDAAGKYYPAAAYISEIDINKLAEDISSRTALTDTEIIGVIRSLLEAVPKYMMLGYKVRLDGFGIFKISLITDCKGHEKATEVTVDDIEGIKVMYTPDAQLRAKLKKPEYVKIDAKYLSDDTESESQSSEPSSVSGE